MTVEEKIERLRRGETVIVENHPTRMVKTSKNLCPCHICNVSEYCAIVDDELNIICARLNKDPNYNAALEWVIP